MRLTLLVVLLAAQPLRADDAPLTYADPNPRRYDFAVRASEIDPRVKSHPEIDFVLEKNGKPQDVGSQLWIGGVIELVCGVMIALGVFTRPAAFLSSGTMAVAYIQYHWKFSFDDRLLPVINKGESAALYCFVFLLFAVRGGGAYSLARLLRRT